MTSTTEEITASDIGIALGAVWVVHKPDQNSRHPGKRFLVRDFELASWYCDRATGDEPIAEGVEPNLPPYLEDSPEGYGTLAEWKDAVRERGWMTDAWLNVEGRWRVRIFAHPAEIDPWEPWVAFSLARAEECISLPMACWTAFVRAVRASEGVADLPTTLEL